LFPSFYGLFVIIVFRQQTTFGFETSFLCTIAEFANNSSD